MTPQTVDRPERCDACGEPNPEVRITVTTLDGVVLDTAVLHSRSCFSHTRLEDILTVGNLRA